MFRLKKLFSLLIVTLMILPLASCAGIGDGALIGDIELDGERIVCAVEAYTGDNELLDSFKMDGAPANELFAYMTEYEYDEQVIDSIMSDPYVVVSFERYDLKGVKLSDLDPENGRKYQYRVTGNDNTAQRSAESEYYDRLGNANGLYQKIVELFNVRSQSNGYFCSIYSSEPYSAYVKAKADSGYRLYKLLTDAEYITGLDRTANEKAYYIIGFNGASDKSYYVYEDDFVEEFDSTVEDGDLYKPLGHVKGIYATAERYFIEALKTTNNKDREVGAYLNRLTVRTKTGIMTVNDFSDIGCVYLEKDNPSMKNGEYCWRVYFQRVSSLYELEQKAKILEAREDVTYVMPIGFMTIDD